MAIVRRLANAVGVLRSQGAGAFFRAAGFWTTEIWSERYLGIDTAEHVELASLGIADPDAQMYAPVPYQAFKSAMRRLGDVTPNDVFVDYGAGKGRIVVAAATFGIRRVIGVELTSQLSSVAADNIARARRRLRCADVSVVTGDATMYALPNDASILHFFNPFRGETLTTVLGIVRQSLAGNPRKLSIMYANPWYIDPLVTSGEAFPREWLKSTEDVPWPYHRHDNPNGNRYRLYRLDSRI